MRGEREREGESERDILIGRLRGHVMQGVTAALYRADRERVILLCQPADETQERHFGEIATDLKKSFVRVSLRVKRWQGFKGNILDIM